MPDTQARFNCPSCGKSYKWKEQLAGRKVRCTCGHVLVAPMEPPSAEDEDLIPLADEEGDPVATREVVSAPRRFEDISASTVHGDQLVASTAFGQTVSQPTAATKPPTKPKPRPAAKKDVTAPKPPAAVSARGAAPVFRPKPEEKSGGSAFLRYGLPVIAIAIAAAVFVWWKFFRGE